MAETPGVRVRVFGWSETWRVVPERDGERWRFRIVLDARSTGRAAPPFLERTEWTADELVGGLDEVKAEIRSQAEAARRRAFLVDEEEEEEEEDL